MSPRSYLRSVKGALFLSPLTVGFGQEAIAAAARQGLSTHLPFPTVIASASYPFIDRLLAVADAWGSQIIEIGAEPAAYPTNRQAVHTEDTARLLVLLPLLQGAASDGPLTSVHVPPCRCSFR